MPILAYRDPTTGSLRCQECHDTGRDIYYRHALPETTETLCVGAYCGSCRAMLVPYPPDWNSGWTTDKNGNARPPHHLTGN